MSSISRHSGQCADGGASLTAETCAEHYEGDQDADYDEHNECAYYPRSNALSSLSPPRIVILIALPAHDL
jgi:hypothetical protein